jgi:poly(A) polymerase
MSQKCDRADALAVLQRLRQAGHIAYFAGGCVRDELLGLSPKDYDIATDAPPSRVRELFTNTQAVGAAFGVILVRHAGSVVEIATFRTDLEYHDGRRPEGVKFATAEEDAQRRDFTINGLFLDPIENRVIDYIGGQADLTAKILRAIGNPDQRFAEDHLRLLRAVRFASRFELQIEPTTAAAITAHAHQLPRISPERLADELRRMLISPTKNMAWKLLWQLELLEQLFRFLPADGHTPFMPDRSIFLNLPPTDSFPLAAATLDYLWQRAGRPNDLRQWLSKPAIAQINRAMRKGLKISNDETDQLHGTLSGAAILLSDAEPTVAEKKRFLATPTAAATRSLLDALAAISLFTDRISKLRSDLDQLQITDFAPPPLITGDDLTNAGASPGPAFKRALAEVYDAQLEGRVTTRDEAMQIAMEIVKAS